MGERWNTTLFIGWDEPGGTYDHVPPGPVPAPDAAAFCPVRLPLDRSRYRVPAIVVSPWVEPGAVGNEEHRHTSMLATLRESWGLGQLFTQRECCREAPKDTCSAATPTDPDSWNVPEALPTPALPRGGWSSDKSLSTFGKAGLPESSQQPHG